MRSSVLSALLVCAACGSMSMHEEDDDWVQAEAVDRGPLNAAHVPTDEHIPHQTDSLVGQTYRFQFSEGVSDTTPGTMELIGSTLVSDIAIELLSDRNPFTDVLLGAVYLHLTPATQDACVATRRPIEAFTGLQDGFQVDFNGRGLDLGQPFEISKLSLTGSWNEDTRTIHTASVLIEANARDFAEALFGSSGPESCEQLAKHGLTCVECDTGACISVVIDEVPVHEVPTLSIEPLSPADVLQASCD